MKELLFIVVLFTSVSIFGQERVDSFHYSTSNDNDHIIGGKRYFGVSRLNESKEMGRRLDKSISKKDKQILLSPIDNNDYIQFLQAQREEQVKSDSIKTLKKKYQFLIQQNKELEGGNQAKQNIIFACGIVIILGLVLVLIKFIIK